MKQQTYKIKSKQTLRKAKAQNLKVLKQRLMAFSCLCLVGYYIFPNKPVESIINVFNKITEFRIFELREIEIIGIKKLGYKEIVESTGLSDIKSVFQVNLDLIKEILQGNNWVEEVSIQRILPSKIKITVKEKVPQAIWWKGKRFYLIDLKGSIIEEVSENQLSMGYILVAGADANIDYHIIADKLFHNKIIGEVLSIAKVGNRRWDLYLRGDILVKLPEYNIDKSLEMLLKILKGQKKPLRIIDLRLIPDKIYIEFKA